MAYVINPDLCMACGTCQGECPTGAIKEGDIDCGTCAGVCPCEAIAPGE